MARFVAEAYKILGPDGKPWFNTSYVMELSPVQFLDIKRERVYLLLWGDTFGGPAALEHVRAIEEDCLDTCCIHMHVVIRSGNWYL